MPTTVKGWKRYRKRRRFQEIQEENEVDAEVMTCNERDAEREKWDGSLSLSLLFPVFKTRRDSSVRDGSQEKTVKKTRMIIAEGAEAKGRKRREGKGIFASGLLFLSLRILISRYEFWEKEKTQGQATDHWTELRSFFFLIPCLSHRQWFLCIISLLPSNPMSVLTSKRLQESDSRRRQEKTAVSFDAHLTKDLQLFVSRLLYVVFFCMLYFFRPLTCTWLLQFILVNDWIVSTVSKFCSFFFFSLFSMPLKKLSLFQSR